MNSFGIKECDKLDNELLKLGWQEKVLMVDIKILVVF